MTISLYCCIPAGLLVLYGIYRVAREHIKWGPHVIGWRVYESALSNRTGYLGRQP